MEYAELTGRHVLVMGLGAHGGGEATARYCAEHGARVTVTDLRDRETLREGVDRLAGLDIEFVMSEHRESDFRNADIVIKNPAVPRTSRYLNLATRIETDISLFFERHSGPVLGVTGSKGKSTTASALHHIVSRHLLGARLGGNITVSPLSFVDELEPADPVVLELSSFQLGDLLLTRSGQAGDLPRLNVAIVTNLLPDHQNYYTSMDDYARDKAIIHANQRPDDWVILPADDPLGRYPPPHPDHVVWVDPSGPAIRGHSAGFSGGEGYLWLRDHDPEKLLPDGLAVPGEHQRTNLLMAAVGAYLAGVPAGIIRQAATTFTGVPHRLEVVAKANDVVFVNDSAATIAEATLAAVRSFASPVHLIAGGSDKGVPLELFAEIATHCDSIHLLEGTATDRIASVLSESDIRYTGPHSTLEEAVDAARQPGVVLLSPGCASFGMFRNEFDRGDQFRAIARKLTGEKE